MSNTLFENIQTTAIHTDAERETAMREILENERANIRTAHVRRAARTLQTLRARRDKEANDMRFFEHERRKLLEADPDRAADAPAPFEMDIAHCQKSYALYDRAAAVWADELILFMCDLRRDLGELLIAEFGNAWGGDLAQALENETI